MASDEQEFQVTGRVEEAETGRPLAQLVVRAFDRDPVFDDKLGFATTDDQGRFAIRFGTADFRDLWESRPDLYLRVYDAAGTRLLHETTDAIRWNASTSEHYRIRIPSRDLAPPKGPSR
jgi:hypothetical protein